MLRQDQCNEQGSIPCLHYRRRNLRRLINIAVVQWRKKVDASCKGMVENSDTVRFRDAIGSLNIM